jgi:hypothetical protein
MRFCFSFFLACLVASFHISCEDPEMTELTPQCEAQVEFGPYTLDDSIRVAFPYTGEIQRLIFEDPGGSEYTFNLDTTGIGNTKVFYARPCPADTTQSIVYIQWHETQSALFSNKTLGITLNFRFFAAGYHDDRTLIGESDILYLEVYQSNLVPIPGLRFQLKYKHGVNYWQPISPHDSIMINNHLFNDVYYQPLGEIPGQEWIGYFTFDQGLVGLEHPSGNLKLALSRIE